ncbi:hypothetical protein Nepgr_033386 [Nepenthes gracilis]|uniref:Transmembrane protein n=1 Tax=Nepenthes gracilis TaxID=150966 RepID=A0AAD3Y6J4_NEPGR|nr:hypothetical protein Nepgr_033386 [Nepenthes gracilis]
MEEDNPARLPMARTIRIMRRSIHTFLQYYQYFTSTSALVALPFSLSILLSQALIPRSISLLPTIYGRLHSLFDAAGFSPPSDFFALVNLKLSQTISSSVVTLPFALSFLLVAKASVIHALNHHKQSLISIYNPLLLTHICNYLLMISANATSFALLFLGFNCLGISVSSPKWVLLFTVLGAVFYCILVANAVVVCNLASMVSGIEATGGSVAILRACVLIRGRVSTALALAVPLNLGLATLEALFHYRIVRPYYHSERPFSSIASEGIFIAYLYSVLIVLDVITSCFFYRSCKEAAHIDDDQFNFTDVKKLGSHEDFV